MLAIKIVQHVHSCAYIAKHFWAFAHTVHVVSWVSAQHTSLFWPAWALTQDRISIRLYRSCYIDPLKCGTWGLTWEWALAWDTIVHMKILR